MARAIKTATRTPPARAGASPSPAAALQLPAALAAISPALRTQALTHRSFSATHNERLEFLGDSVLNLCVSQWLYTRYPDVPEGELSRMRALLVRQETLHRIAQHLQLGAHLRLGEGEKQAGGALRPSILADAVEALVGALYLEAGLSAAQAFVRAAYDALDVQAADLAQAQDAKTQLQELLQSRKLALPTYKVTGTTGAAHALRFTVACTVPQTTLHAQGQGASKRAAEQDAAAALLRKLEA